MGVGEPILIPVDVDGTTATCLFDTGSTHHVLDPPFATHLGEPLITKRSSEPGSPSVMRAFNPPAMSVGRLALEGKRPVISFSLTPISQALGIEVQGILGAPFLANRVMTLDVDRQQVVFSDADSHEPESEGMVIDVDAAGRPYLPGVTVGDATLSFLVDTGHIGPSISLEKAVFQRLCEQGLITSVRASLAKVAGGESEGRSGVLKTFRIGPFSHSSVTVTEDDANILGINYLSRFVVTLDMANRRIHLAKGEGYKRPDFRSSSGLALLWIGGNVVVASVDQHSPADRAGISEGDLLVEINGREASGDALNQIRQELHGASGSRMDLVISRDGAKQRKRFRLQKYEDWSPDSRDAGAKASDGRE